MIPSRPARVSSPSALWKFSLKIYSLDSVERAFLELQESKGLNINMLLFCFWWTASGQGKLGKLEIKKLLSEIAAWHERIVLPLRRLRTSIKKNPLSLLRDKLYADMLEIELLAEQVEQSFMENIFRIQQHSLRPIPQKLADAIKSIGNYCNLLQICLDEKDIDNLVKLITAIYPNAKKEEIKTYCTRIIGLADAKSTMTTQLALEF